ncbi:MAG: hypothetical protein ABIV51_05010 [Saprospiraceae bacterium]
MIPESTIDQICEALEANPKLMDKLLDELSENQDALVAYLLDEENKATLTEEEQDYQIFLGLVIWNSFRDLQGKLPEISADSIADADEKNWELMNTNESKSFQERLTPFFTNYPQEDLLAFVEDAVMDDEDELVSTIGREPMFVTLKTLIDVLHDVTYPGASKS